MTPRAQRRVFLALFITMILGCGLYVIGREAMPLSFDPSIQSFWEDDPQDSSAAGYYYPYSSDVAFLDEGITLSQLKELPIHALSLEGIDTSGKVHIHSTFEDTLTYDPTTGVTQTIGGPDHFYPGDSAMTPDGRWYSLIRGMDDTYLALIDPATGMTRDLGNVRQTTDHLLVGSYDQVYGFAFYSWPILKYDPRTDLLAPVPFSDTYQLDTYIENELIGQDDWLYGTLRHETPTIFALNLTNGELVTRAMSMSVDTLVPRPGGGVYFYSGQNFWTFDSRGTLTPLPPVLSEKNFYPDLLVLQSNGHLAGRSIRYLPYFFDYDPITGAFRRLPSKANSGYYDRLMAAPNGDLYTTWDDYLALIDSGQYTTTGSVLSQFIYPATLTLTDTIVGGNNASIAALACGQNGKVYGVKSDPTTSKWLFEYDPHQPETAARQIAPNVSTEDKGRFLGGTALVPLSDGRLVGGTNNGHLFVYTPATDKTWDVGQPVEGAQAIASLAVDGAGMVYGGTLSYEHHAVLFSFDPATDVTKTIALPVVDPTLIGAVMVGPDKRVYVGVDRNLVIYDPQTQQATTVKAFEYNEGFLNSRAVCTIRALITGPDGQVYGGCGSHLFTYEPPHDTWRDLGMTEDGGSIASLTIGGDKQIYGSVEHEYMSRYPNTYRDNKIFVYDPAEQRLTNLGMAVKTGPVILAACGDGTIYGGSNTTNSNYSGPAHLFAFRTDCPQGAIGAWDKVTWQGQTPPGTRITMDVISIEGVLMRDIENGGSLQAIDAQQHPAIRLRANLSTTDPRVTPTLKRWRVDYTFACQK